VTFSKQKNADEKFQISISTSVFNIEAEKWTSNWKMLKNPMLMGYTAIPMLSELTFSMAIIFTSPGVAVTSEINMADTNAEVV